MKRYLLTAMAALAIALPGITSVHAAAPQGAVTQALARSAAPVSALPADAGSGGNSVQPFATIITLITPSSANRGVPVTFAYQWSGGGFCCESFHATIDDARGNEVFHNDYTCNLNCSTGYNSFTAYLYGYPGLWQYCVKGG